MAKAAGIARGPTLKNFELQNIPVVLKPGEVAPLELYFMPKALGLRTTMLRFPYSSNDEGSTPQVSTSEFKVRGWDSEAFR